MARGLKVPRNLRSMSSRIQLSASTGSPYLAPDGTTRNVMLSSMLDSKSSIIIATRKCDNNSNPDDQTLDI